MTFFDEVVFVVEKEMTLEEAVLCNSDRRPPQHVERWLRVLIQ